MALIRPEQLRISGSDIQIGEPSTGGYNIGALNSSMSIADALNVVAIQGSGTIGTPDDGTYTDGFFDYWTSDTRMPNAFDDINELLPFIVPDKPGLLTGQDLDRNTPSVFSGYLSAGLDSGSWYVDFAAGDEVTTLVDNYPVVQFDSPDSASRFYGGLSSSFAGGISASRAYGLESLVVVNSRSLSDGVGSTGIIETTAITVYNNIWLNVNGRITDTVSETGSVKYVLGGGLGGDSNEYQLFHAGNLTEFPTQSFDTNPYTSSLTPAWKYMSGIQYYGRGTELIINYYATDLYNPVYSDSDETQITSSYFATVYPSTSSFNPPSSSWDFPVTQSRILTNDVKTTYDDLGTFTVTLVKPGKSNNVSNPVDIGNRAINTYLTESTDLIEYFLDEDKRWNAIDSASWNNTLSIADMKQLEVNNGRLLSYGNYQSRFYEEHLYYRPFTPTIPNENGTIIIVGSGFGASSIVEWVDGGFPADDTLTMAFVIASESGSFIYDLGRVVSDDSGSIYGIRNGDISGNTITWNLPPGHQTTNSDPLILMVRFYKTTNFLTQLTVTFEQG